MNINPSTMKELLQLQMLNKMSFLSSDNTSSSDKGDNSSFTALLNDILSQSPDSRSSASQAVKSGLMKPMAYYPQMVMMDGGAGASELAAHASAYDPIIQDASRRHGVAPSLVKAVIDAESSFNTNAVSGAGAKGLMQLMDQTGRGLGVSNPFDPSQNIQGGTRYLSNLLAKYNGNRGVALAAYNAGPGRIDRLGITNDQELMSNLHLLPSETQQYVNKVLKLQRNYEA
ncbi:lytic transglycosylase domain-containing protein [Paenibacillus rigui]|uniref:Lytic transglycosylase n=1 Tax=Paenibacillus rigui TaxID=554312 RepID=A0A229URG3_9BACL|nr:lytic transglycosylase domain-containing protein [Paenibacillus rigui]OXM86086.1 lytic transglycosylase [Paenibacillus rigui]